MCSAEGTQRLLYKHSSCLRPFTVCHDGQPEQLTCALYGLQGILILTLRHSLRSLPIPRVILSENQSLEVYSYLSGERNDSVALVSFEYLPEWASSLKTHLFCHSEVN